MKQNYMEETMPKEKKWNYLWDKLIEHAVKATSKYQKKDMAYKRHVSHIPIIIEEIRDMRIS